MIFEGNISSTRRFISFYGTGVINTAFGYFMFCALVYLSINIYLSQLISHFTGMVFNYFSFGKLTFSDRQGSKLRFALLYLANYFISIALLYGTSRLTGSPYIAGFVTLVIASVISYFVLNRFVFRPRKPI